MPHRHYVYIGSCPAQERDDITRDILFFQTSCYVEISGRQATRMCATLRDAGVAHQNTTMKCADDITLTLLSVGLDPRYNGEIFMPREGIPYRPLSPVKNGKKTSFTEAEMAAIVQRHKDANGGVLDEAKFIQECSDPDHEAHEWEGWEWNGETATLNWNRAVAKHIRPDIIEDLRKGKAK